MIRPIEQARHEFERIHPTGDFAALVAGYLASGFVYSGDDAFILAMPRGEDTWFVHLAAGRVSRFQELAPQPRPWIAWHRRGERKLRRYSWERFKRLTSKH